MKLRLKVPLEDNQMPGCPCPRLITLEQRLANPATMLAHSCWLPISPPPVSQAAHIQILACDFSLFMRSAMKILPSTVPLVLYPFCSKHKIHIRISLPTRAQAWAYPTVSSFPLFPLLQSYIAAALVSASETHHSPSQNTFWSSIK